MPTITDTGRRKKQFQTTTVTNFTALERLLLHFYAARFNKNVTEIIRGMVHKYIELDRTFDPQEFAAYAEKVLVPQEHDPDLRGEMRKQLRAFKKEQAA